MKRSLQILILLLPIVLAVVRPVSAETIEETIDLEVGEEFWLNVREHFGINGSYMYEKQNDWIGDLENGTFYGKPTNEGTYWLNITTDDNTYHIKIIVINAASTRNQIDIQPGTVAVLIICTGAVIVTTIIVFSMTDVGKWVLMSLFNKLTPQRILTNENRKQIYVYIVEHPWANYTEIHQELNIPYRTLRHHLKKLIEHDFVIRKVDGAYVRFKAEH